VRADRDDYVGPRACRVDRRGPALGTLLFAGQSDDDEDGFEVYVLVGCPVDSVSACQGTATIAVRGGRRVMRRRFRIRRGRQKWVSREVFSARTIGELFSHDATARVRFSDAAGRTRTFTRFIDVYVRGVPD
jgi:hypothetical protein